jgi:hypothetical protein
MMPAISGLEPEQQYRTSGESTPVFHGSTGRLVILDAEQFAGLDAVERVDGAETVHIDVHAAFPFGGDGRAPVLLSNPTRRSWSTDSSGRSPLALNTSAVMNRPAEECTRR